MSLEELVAAYMRKPSGVLLGLIDKADKARKLNEAQQGQQALAQMQQQQGTVADEKLAQVLQGAGGMRRMATGGIVALAGGGDPEVQRILRKAPAARTAEENAKLEAAGIRLERRVPAPEGSTIQRLNRFLESPFIRETFTGGAERLSAEELRQRTDAGALTEHIARTLGAKQVVAPLPAAPTAAAAQTYPEPLAVREGRRATPPGAAAPPSDARRERVVESATEPPAATPPAATPNTLAQAYAELLKASEAPAVSPALQAQREKVTGLQALQEQQALSNIRNLSEERTRVGQRRMDRADMPFFDDAQALAALAASIDTRKGRVFGSLGTGIASALSEREARKQKAEEYLATQDDRIRSLNNTYQQLQLENATYQQALLEGDGAKAQASREKLAKLRYDAAVKEQELQNDRMRAEAAQAQARAQGVSAAAQTAAIPGRQALAEAALLEKRMKSPEGIQYAQLAAAKAKLMENPLTDKTAIANIDAELTRLQRLMDVKYGGIASVAPSSPGSADTANVDAAAEAIIRGGQ